MILTFIIIAGTLATGAALLLLLPLMRRREDARPAASIPAIVVLLVTLLGGAGLYAAFSNYAWTDTSSAADTPAAMTARLAKRLAKENGSVEDWLLLGQSYVTLQQYPLALRAYQHVDQMTGNQNAQALMGMAEILVQENMEELRGRAGRMFERALELDPGSRRALFYSAFAALGRSEPALARQRFTQMLEHESDPEIRALISKGLESASQQEAQAAGGPAPAAAGTAKIAVHVTLAPALASKVPAGATLF